MSDDELREAMRGSAMKRTKVAGLRRNLELALANAEIGLGRQFQADGSAWRAQQIFPGAVRNGRGAPFIASPGTRPGNPASGDQPVHR